MAAEWVLDHVFVTVDARGSDAAHLRALGLEPSYSRTHPGQGSANLCFCLDNAYLELLWLTDLAEADGCVLARTAWRARLDAHAGSGEASPFGIAIRPADPDADTEMPFRSWRYRPGYLPPGTSIRIARASDDPRLPFLFRSPGNTGPMDWTDGRGRALQRAAGLARIEVVALRIPGPRDAALARALAPLDWLGLFWGSEEHGMDLILSDQEGGLRKLTLPVPPVER